uniref:C2 domain-containing protein n=1 Tax=Timema douglasi TaxID=61478 RepID=A0A7R8Z364_TIMDO|nr:unnamed protein product [Timema douglasi]
MFDQLNSLLASAFVSMRARSSIFRRPLFFCVFVVPPLDSYHLSRLFTRGRRRSASEAPARRCRIVSHTYTFDYPLFNPFTITCDFEATPALQLKAFRQKGEKVEVSHYRVNVNRFRARLNIICVTEKMLADIKCDGWPDIKIALAPVGSIKNNMDEQQLQDVITEIVVVAMRNSTAHLNLGQYPTCPRLVRQTASQGYNLPLHYDSMSGNASFDLNAKTEVREYHRRQDITSEMSNQYSSIPTKTAVEKRLLVKVVKAIGLGGKKGCSDPYCVVEMDEPSQKNQTSIKKDTNAPVWDEHFLFDVSPNTAELLFEIYDHVNKEKRFLGLGIVGMEELLINPSQRQTISLQSRPFERDEVSGTLTVEFLFIEGADIPQLGDKPYKLKETLRTVSPTGGVVTTTKTVFEKPGAVTEPLTNGEDVVTDSALRELEARNRGGPAQTSKSTLIIHSVHRVEQSDSGEWHEVSEQQGTREQLGQLDGTDNTAPNGTLDDRSRSRRKKRDIFGTIKKRLGRSKARSKSMDPGDKEDTLNADSSINRSISADRARDPSAHSTGYLSVPGMRGIDGNSTRSSLSEASGVSGASTRTYVNEASTLVLETVENGVKNGTPCHVCTKPVARRLGKQGYECRDCQLKCHKHCHIKVDTTCTSSTIQSIELQTTRLLHHKSPHGQEAVPVEEWLDSKTDTTLSPRYGTTLQCDSEEPPQANTLWKKTHGLMELGFYKLMYDVMFQVLRSCSS